MRYYREAVITPVSDTICVYRTCISNEDADRLLYCPESICVLLLVKVRFWNKQVAERLLQHSRWRYISLNGCELPCAPHLLLNRITLVGLRVIEHENIQEPGQRDLDLRLIEREFPLLQHLEVDELFFPQRPFESLSVMHHFTLPEALAFVTGAPIRCLDLKVLSTFSLHGAKRLVEDASPTLQELVVTSADMPMAMEEWLLLCEAVAQKLTLHVFDIESVWFDDEQDKIQHQITTGWQQGRLPLVKSLVLPALAANLAPASVLEILSSFCTKPENE